jgi:hypothetical protein
MSRVFAILAVLAAAVSGARGQPDRQLGLELRLVPVASSGATIGLSLREYADLPTGLDEETLGRLRAYGLRVVAVPVEALPRATRDLTPVGTVQTETLGMLYRWAPLVTGPELEEQYTTVDTGPLELPPGRFRLLARAWLVPDLGEAQDTGRVAARLRVELLPQHEEAHRRRLDQLLDPAPRTIEDDGLLFRRLHAIAELPEGRALVIVPAPPDADWAALRPPGPADETLPEGETSYGPDPDAVPEREPAPRPERPTTEPRRAAVPVGAGPAAPSFRTLGVQLLRRPAGAMENPGAPDTYQIQPERSLVVVLIPHVPSRYALIP